MQGLEVKSSASVGDWTLVVQSVVRHYTVWATPVPMKWCAVYISFLFQFVWCSGWPLTLCQYFRILFLRSFPIRSEHRSDSQQLRNYAYLKFKMIWALCRTSGLFLHFAASKIQWCSSLFCLLCVHTPSFSFNPHMWKSRRCLVQWPQWPILQTIMTSPSIRELLIQVLHHVSTEVWGAPPHWMYICNHVLCHSDHL
jgi:hypothetical protein